MKILIVDDSSTMRKIVMRTLRQAGYEAAEILEAGDGSEGLEQVSKAGDVDLVFCDVNMPNMNGLDFVQAVRADDSSAAIPIVMVTTEGGQEAIHEAMARGANAYVVKPFTPEKIGTVVSEILG